MRENIKIVRECRRLETDMNIPPADNNLYGRILRSVNIPYDIRHKQMDNKNSRGQKPNIPPRLSSLQTNRKLMTTDISTHPASSKDMTIGNTSRQEHIQIPTNPKM